jgi:hypothetical protein
VKDGSGALFGKGFFCLFQKSGNEQPDPVLARHEAITGARPNKYFLSY